MAETKTLQTVIILRNDSSTKWADSDVILERGETGIAYLSNGNIIVKAGDGENKWADLKQVEGVLENDMLLTYSFGKHSVPTGGYVNAGGKDMTFSQWFADSLKKTVEPTIKTYPNATLSATCPNTGNSLEIGSYITTVNYTGSFGTKGTYNVNGKDVASGLKDSDCTWSVTLGDDASSKKTTSTGSYTINTQINSTSEATYATVKATATLDVANVVAPTNNLGESRPDAKIKGFDAAGNKTKSLTAYVKATGYRKPFWGWKSTAEALSDPTAITPAQVRALGKSGTSTGGLPTSLTVPAGTKQVYFAANAGTKTSLTVKNITKEPATGVACTKVAKALKVEGANGYTAVDYDLWYINLDAAFTGETKLSLTWA